MKQTDYLNSKIIFDHRKRIINSKIFQPDKTTKDSPLFNNVNKITMGKKYMQQHNIFKQQRAEQPKKQHREIVISEQFIRSSKLYSLLRQKIDRSDMIFMRQFKTATQTKNQLKQQIMMIKGQNYQEKLSLWEMKNKLMELKIIYHEEEEERKRLELESQENYQHQQEQNLEYTGQEQEQNHQHHHLMQNDMMDEEIHGQNQQEQSHHQQEQGKAFSSILHELMQADQKDENPQQLYPDKHQQQQNQEILPNTTNNHDLHYLHQF